MSENGSVNASNKGSTNASANAGETKLNDLIAAVRQFCQERDWDQFHDARNLAIGLVTESAELLEEFRFLTLEECENAFNIPEKRQAIEDEIADAMFFLLRLADRYNVDLKKALLTKIEKSARKYPVEKAKGSKLKYDKL